MATILKEKNWGIIDDNGIIYYGYDEYEMRQIFDDIIEGNEELRWDGDLRLVQFHAAYR